MNFSEDVGIKRRVYNSKDITRTVAYPFRGEAFPSVGKVSPVQ